MAELRLTAEQQAVVENRGGSLLVSAAAGSGKTKVLVERVFRFITEEKCSVDDFLIITYTRAAAAELRTKIAEELSRRIAADPGDRHLRRQLLRVYQADIRTVDAFCTALLRENTHLLSREEDRHSLSPDFRVLDENEARLLRERVLSRELEEFYEHMDEGGRALADGLGFGRDDRSLEALVLEVYEKLQSHAYPGRWLAENLERWQALAEGEGDFDRTPYAQTLLRGVVRRCGYWQAMLRHMALEMTGWPALEKGYAGRFLAAADSMNGLLSAAEEGNWTAACLAAAQVTFPKLGAVKAADGGELKTRAKTVWDGCKAAAEKWTALLSVSAGEAMEDLRASAPAMIALLGLTDGFARRYRQEKLRRNAADFSDQEHLALGILVGEDGSPTELGRQVAARYREILVDEYQDTNEVQNAIFRAVSREGQNLFTVGDVKQSIYRFRLADPTIFLEKYERFPLYTQARDGEERKILLSKNFRSRREVLDGTNFIFANILSREMGEMDYGEDEALHFGAEYYPERKDCAVEYHLISAQRKQAGEEFVPVKRLTAEAQFTALRIRQLLDEGFPVTEKDGTLRPCRPEDIVILMRSPGSRAAAYAQALAEWDIPCAAEENEDFFSTMEVATVLSLLEVIDNPRQDIPLISVLRSPIFGFTPDRLAELRADTPKGEFYDAVTASEEEDCRAFLAELERFRLLSRDMTVHQLLWQIYDRLNVLGVFGAMDGGRRRRENLVALTEQAQRLEGGGYCGLFSFVTELRRLIESGRAPAVRGGAEATGVRIMSIHRSKGLEFPVVILTDLEHAFSRQDFLTPVLVHPELGIGPTRVDLERGIKYPTMARLCLEEALDRENKAEEQRILYVAMTRPKEKLILVNAMTGAEKRLKRLGAMAGCPAMPEAVGSGRCFADWLLLPLLCRPEAAPLRRMAEAEELPLYTGDTVPWQIAVHDAEDLRSRPLQWVSDGEEQEPGPEFDPSLLEFVYPYGRESVLPAKLTATQLKGRELDREAAEGAAAMPALRPLTRPKFRRETAGLTAAERGTATHLVLQYLDLADPDVPGQVERLLRRRLLTEEQAKAVEIRALERLLAAPLAEEMRRAERILREYPFTVLLPADAVDPAAESGDRILLQGIVDCCFFTPEGITVVDFKTDRVSGGEILRRAESYRPQLEAYSHALERVLEQPVRRQVLYFLYPGETVEI